MAEPAALAQPVQDPLDRLQQAREQLLAEHGHLVGGQVQAQSGAPDSDRVAESFAPAGHPTDSAAEAGPDDSQPVQLPQNQVASSLVASVEPAQANGPVQDAVPAAAVQQIDLAAWVNALYQLDQTNLQAILRYLPAQQLALALYGIVSVPVAMDCTPAEPSQPTMQPEQTAQPEQSAQPEQTTQPEQAMQPELITDSVLHGANTQPEQIETASEIHRTCDAEQPSVELQEQPQPHEPQAGQVTDEPPADDVEGRQAERQKTLRSGKIIFNNKMSVTDCKIRDISQTGCRLDLQSVIALPRCFTLHIVNGNSYHECEVMWRKDTQMGVQFIG